MNLEDRIKRLEALHPEIEPEVEPKWFLLNSYWRISTNGAQVQRRDYIGDPWRNTDSCPDVARLYRAGLVQGQKQALELAKAVQAARIWRHEHGEAVENYPNWRYWENIVTLARAILEAAE